MALNPIDMVSWIFSVVYALMVLGTALGLVLYRPGKTDRKPFISVLIAARNESEHIAFCLQALLDQSYDRDLFEVIVIDDRSTDTTAAIAAAFGRHFGHFKLVTIDKISPDMAPKKHALNEGVKIAQGEIILCTDADCRPEKNWIGALAACFTDEVGMVVGYSPIEPKSGFSVFQNFIALDSLALASVAAGSSAFHATATATGRSLAYRKKLFEEVGGFSKIAHVISGDDDLLLGLVRKTKWKIAYSIQKDSLVYTDPPQDFRKFVNQKIRQASKGRLYSPKMVLGLVLFYVFNLLLITYLPWKWITMHHEFKYGLPLFLKISSDLVILMTGAWRFDKWSYLKMYPVMAILHPIYIVIFGFWGQFGRFEWKDPAAMK